mmetsp:Transcript_9705/g.14473  ORF Transcript_9705/g.14473 Transcript_9705/m.14473 type:complete len:317 (-) Transcript_9705:120-1070(-)|eukprot:scaffold11037_cov155-Skeletonema_dohrnii-CCMP3373.AAC.5
MKYLLSVATAALSIGLTTAAPAIVWKAGSSPASPSHISEQIDTLSLLDATLNNDDSAAASSTGLSAVIFLVGRDADGSEGLVTMASSGKLPGVQEKHAHADSIHYHVDGVESSRTVAKDARLSGGMNVVEVALDEFHRKLASLAQSEQEEELVEDAAVEGGKKVNKAEQKRRRAISEADVLIVSVTDKDNAAAIDSSIVKAIDSKVVQNVILSSIRSTDEVKRSRRMAVVDKMNKSARSASAGRRRLDEDNENNNDDGNQQQEEGVYYVNMTPNILAGILFFFMFVMVTHLGLSCMNMIEGQDVYVKKLPAIGREV